MALRDVQTCFVTCRKSFSEDALQFFSRGRRGRRNTFATFSEDALQFLWQAQHFGRVHRLFARQAQHFRRVVLRVFCESHCQSGLRQVATRCEFRGRRGIL